MAKLLQNRLLETLREELGGTYGVSVSPELRRRFRSRSTRSSIQFGCDPARLDELTKRVIQEIEQLKTKGPTADQVNDVKQALLRDFETNSKQNGYLVSQIAFKYEYGEDLASFFNILDIYNTIDARTIQDAAKAYFDTGNYVQVTLVPEKKG